MKRANRYRASGVIRLFYRQTLVAACLSFALSTTGLHTAVAQNQDDYFHTQERNILDAKPFEVVRKSASTSVSSSGSQKQSLSKTQLSFKAFNEQFDLDLEDNDRLFKRSGFRQLQGARFYRGKIQGVDGSWVRMNEVEGVYSGAIYDGKELYIIDETRHVESDFSSWLKEEVRSQKADSVVYRLSDTTDNMACAASAEVKGSIRPKPKKSHSYRDFIKGIQRHTAESSFSLQGSDDTQAPVVAMATATERLNVVIVADVEYAARAGGNTETQVMSQMNIVDGIFSEQVGVQMHVDRIIELSNNGSLGTNNATNLLDDFRNYVRQEISNPGLTHLFSGRNFSGNVLGVAFFNGLCNSYGVGVTQANGGGVYGALTAAHEFGHNFGAPHDNQSGSQCSSTSGGFLMNPSINGSDQFSQCSLNQISPNVSRASCLEPISSTPTPTATPTHRHRLLDRRPHQRRSPPLHLPQRQRHFPRRCHHRT